jgi:hypothetical protein
MRPKQVFLVLLNCCCLLFSRASWAGVEHGNAGDAFAAEFILTARDLVQRMQPNQSVIRQWVDISRLSGAILATKVRTEENLKLGGRTVDAVNIPAENLILVNRDRWREYRSAIETKARLTLVLHEYLGVIGEEDSQFQISGRIIGFLNVQNYSPGTWWNPLNPVNFVATTLLRGPVTCQLRGASFDPSYQGQRVELETTGDCEGAYRRVVISKLAAINAPTEQIRGIYHHFEMKVYDANGIQLGEVDYEPEWGRCVLPEDGTCRLSGPIKVGGVEFVFWYQRH